MAKTTNPLFSLTAAGTIAGCIEYRHQPRNSTAQYHGKAPNKPTPAQAQQRDGWKDAATAWRALPSPDRAKWAAYAAQLSLPPFAAYGREWQLQQITAPDTPRLPALLW